MGGFSSSKNRRVMEPRVPMPPPVFDQELANRLFAASPLVNTDIRRTLADTYATILMQISDLKARVIAGVISVDEARTIPTLINHLRKIAADLRLLKSKEELGLQLDPLSVREDSEDEDN